MSGTSPAVDLTARTFESLRARGLDLLRRRVKDVQYADLVATGVVPAIIDVLAWFHEQSAHYHDRRRRNSYLFLADTREAMSILCRALGYRMRPATSASVVMQARPEPPQVASVTIRKGTRVNVGDLTFEAVEDYEIPANATVWPDGTTDDLIIFAEGYTRQEVFTSDGGTFQSFELGASGTIENSVRVSVLGETWDEVENLTVVEGTQRGRDSFSGDGEDAQQYDLTLLNANIILDDDDGLVVLVTPSGGVSADAVLWTQVDELTGAAREFTASQSIDGVTTIRFGQVSSGAAPGNGDRIDALYLVSGAQKRYQLTYDEFDRATIMFGDDVLGVVPPNGASITVDYRIGGGTRGNIQGAVIDEVVQGFLATGARVSVRIKNIEPGRGGEARETVDHARYFAPRHAKSNERAVRQEDWTALAATYRDPNYGAPAHATCYLKQKSPELNTVVCAVWGRDEYGRVSTPGTALKVGIKKYLDSKRTICTTVEMRDGVVIQIDMTIGVVLDTGRDRDTVFAAVRSAVSSFFDSAYVLPGLDLSISRLYDTIQGVDGVQRATIEELTGSVALLLDAGTGDGTSAEFSGDFVLGEGLAIIGGSVAVTDTQQQVIDDGEGGFLGDVDTGGTNIIDYTTGKFSVTFAAPPALGRPVSAEAKVSVYAPHVEDLGSSDGTVTRLDGATDYYPIVKRGPRGMWSREQSLIVDDFRVGATNRFSGRLPRGIDAASIAIEDNVPTVGGLTGSDNGIGSIIGPGILSGSVDYATGSIDFEFNAPPTLPVRIRWTTRKVNIYMPPAYLPLEPGRLWWWVGFRGPTGTQPGGADLNVYDDSTANMSGDALVGGTVNYETGEVEVSLNGNPPPTTPTLVGYAYLTQPPDGTLREFDYEVWTMPGGAGGGGSPVDLREGGVNGEGRTRFLMTDLATPGVAVSDAWDNWQGLVHGASLDEEGSNTVVYGPAAYGKFTFTVPLAAPAARDIPVYVTAVGVVMYSAWGFYVKTPGGPGLDKYLFADNRGRLWGTQVNTYPTDRLDHLRGRYLVDIAGSAIASGRAMAITYDALVGVPPALDVTIQDDQVATVGQVQVLERAPEVIGLV